MTFTPFYMEPLKPGEQVTIEKIIVTYITEVFEIFVIFCIFKIILKKNITFYEIIKLSALLGFVVLIIGLYDYEALKSVRIGILSSVGSKLITL